MLARLQCQQQPGLLSRGSMVASDSDMPKPLKNATTRASDNSHFQGLWKNDQLLDIDPPITADGPHTHVSSLFTHTALRCVAVLM